jgi:hypothetical protein
LTVGLKTIARRLINPVDGALPRTLSATNGQKGGSIAQQRATAPTKALPPLMDVAIRLRFE